MTVSQLLPVVDEYPFSRAKLETPDISTMWLDLKRSKILDSKSYGAHTTKNRIERSNRTSMCHCRKLSLLWESLILLHL